MGDVGVLSFDWNFLVEMLFSWINVGIVAFILYKLLYNPVRKFMQARQDRIADQIKSAETSLKDAESLKSEYEAKLKNIEQEKAEILDNARKRGSDKEQQIIDAAKSEAETLKNRAKLDIEREKDKVQDEMKREMIEVASLMASKFVKTNMDEDSKAKLLDAAIADLGDVKWPS